MRQMLHAQHAVLARLVEGRAESVESTTKSVTVAIAPGAQAVKNSCYSRGCDLRVIGKHCGDGVPEDLRPRGVMRLEVVGVKLDQSRNQIVVAPFDRRAYSRTALKSGDAARF